jgi:broad specificity phosphatase PhoE
MTRVAPVHPGQTEWNRVERCRGHVDVPQDETGAAQAEAAARCAASEWRKDIRRTCLHREPWQLTNPSGWV